MTFGEDKKRFPSNYISRSFLQTRGTFLSYKNFTLQVKRRPLKSYFCASVDYRSPLKFNEFLFQYRPFVINASGASPKPQAVPPRVHGGFFPIRRLRKKSQQMMRNMFLAAKFGGFVPQQAKHMFNVCIY